jgi:hypothetical protein
MALLVRSQGQAAYPAAATSTLMAAPLIFASGEEILPIGGFTGQYPYPSLSWLENEIASGRLRLILVAPIDDPRITWIKQHCIPLPQAPAQIASVKADGYYCVGAS